MTRSGKGLQSERTALAWRRAVLALVAGALLILRLLPPALGGWGLGAGVIALVAAVTLWALGERRIRRLRQALAAPSGPLPDGRLLLAVALAVAGGGGISLLYLLVAQPLHG